MSIKKKKVFNLHPTNSPLAKPGVYGLYNFKTSKWYVGYSKDLTRRIYEHIQYGGHAGHKLVDAITKFGLESFLVVPLYYALVENSTHLLEIESKFIKNFNSIENGYNLLSKGLVFDYGPAHSKACSDAILTNPKRLKRRIEINKERANRPEVKAAFGLRVSKQWEDPKFRESRSKAMSIANTGYIHITNGVGNKSLPPGSSIPDGWFNGTTFKVKPKGGDGKHISGTVWITNEVENVRVLPITVLPKGWRLGRATGWEGGINAANEANVKKRKKLPSRTLLPIRPTTH